MKDYEASFEYDGWFPDWLWKLYKDSPWKSGINYINISRVVKLRERLKDWTIENFVQSLELP